MQCVKILLNKSIVSTSQMVMVSDNGDFLDRHESCRETAVAKENGRIAGRSGPIGRTFRAERSSAG